MCLQPTEDAAGPDLHARTTLVRRAVSVFALQAMRSLKCCGHNAKLAQASVIEAGESLLLRVDVADIDATIQAPRLLAAMSAGQGRALVCLPSGYLMSAFACKRVLLHLLRVEVLHLTFE